jgi:glycosyltransferase involved in cell wall biosynthesis
MPSISVVIPAYNRSATIGLAVGSVLRQTVRDIEVIVVDDGSSDDTVAALEAVDDDRLRIIRHERNAGGSAARNTGIRAATGDWVAFQDSDDEWLPLKLKRQLAAIARFGDNAIGVYCGMLMLGRRNASGIDYRAVRYWPDPKLRPESFEGHLYRTLLHSGNLISTQTFMGRRESLLDIGGFDERLDSMQDWDCFLRLSKLGPIAFEPEPLVIQRFSQNSISKYTYNRAKGHAAILEKHRESLEEMPRRFAKYLQKIGSLHDRNGDFTLARRAFYECLRRDPTRLGAWAGLARLGVLSLTGRNRAGRTCTGSPDRRV